MKVFLDDIEVNSDYVAEITKSGKVYDRYFKLGSAICESYNIKLNKEVGNISNVVKLYDGNILIKTLYVTNINDEDDFFYNLELEDSMTKFNFRYDASQIFVSGSTSLGAILQDICIKAGVNTDISTFYGSTKIISWYDNTYMARDYLSYIAELNGKNLRISADDKLEFVDINTTPVETISFEDIGRYKIGVSHTISKVVYDDGIVEPIVIGNNDGETYYINTDNVYVNGQNDVQYIYNQINGFTFYNFEVDDYPIGDLRTGDLVEFDDGTNSYITFIQFDDATFSQNDWSGKLELEVETEVKQQTEVVGEEDRYRRIKRIVDYDSGRIDQIIEETPTIAVERTGAGSVSLENLLNGRLIRLVIHPTDTDILGLFASTQLKASSSLKSLSRGIHFDGNKDYYYKIPDNLYFLGDVYDEFIYDGVEQKIQIIHRIEIQNGQKVALETPIVEEYDYYDILIGNGNYNVYMSTYPTAYIYVKAMIMNDYTQSFATNYELDSKISQTVESITTEVNKKVDNTAFNSMINQTASSIGLTVEQFNNGDKVSSATILSQINDDTSEVQIKADKISLDGKTINLTSENIKIQSNNFEVDETGKITATSGDIGGFNMDSTSFKKNLNGIYNYTLADATLIYDMIIGFLKKNTNLDYILDYNNDGEVDLGDSAQIIGIINGLIQNTRNFTGTFEINSNDLKNCLVFKNNNGQVITSIGLGGINTDYIYTNNFACGQNPSGGLFKGTLINGEDGTITIDGQNNTRTTISAGQIILQDGQGNTKTITATN